jgi:hypothetical protein
MLPRLSSLFFPHRKLRTIIYGSCHGIALKKALESISSARQRLTFENLPENFEITEDEMQTFLNNTAPEIDVFIYQPTSADARGDLFASATVLKALRPQTRTLTFSYLHFELYNPYTLYPGADMPAFTGTYVDYAVGALVTNGVPTAELKAKWHKGPDFAPYGDACLNQNLKELREREERILPGDNPTQLRFADTIQTSFRSEPLFNSMNHPSAGLIQRLAAQTIAALDIRNCGSDTPHREWLDSAFIPIPEFIRRQYELTFPDRTPVLRGKEMSLDEYIHTQAQYFRALDPQVVKSRITELSYSRPWFKPLLSFK